MSALNPGDNITELWKSGGIEDTMVLEGATVAIMSPCDESGGSYEVSRGTLWREPVGRADDASSWRITHGHGHVFSIEYAITGFAGWHLKLLELPV